MKFRMIIFASFFLFGCASAPVDENRMVVSRQLVAVVMANEESQQAIDNLIPEMMDAVLERNPGLTEAQQSKIMEMVEAELDREIPNLEEYMAELYAGYFFKSELEDLVVLVQEYNEGATLPTQKLRLLQKLGARSDNIGSQLRAYGRSLGEQIGERVYTTLEADGDI